MVEVVVSRLGRDAGSSSYVVILQEKDGQRILPIWIGKPEAESIVAHLGGVRRERPMTHDLCQSILTALGGRLEEVRITKVVENTFYAELHVVVGDRTHVVDARPSDSIAIAIRVQSPIFAAEELLAEYEPSGQPEGQAQGQEPEEPWTGPEFSASLEEHVRSAEHLQRYLEQLRPEDFGKFKI
ncbi:MAG: bifunctional nuclease family protein [Gemmatimonadales bacterium]